MAVTNQKRLKASGTMDYEEMMKIIKYLLDASWGSKWGSFTPDGPNVNDPKDINYPIILHYLSVMEPGTIGKDTKEIKPRFRSAYTNEDVNGNMPPVMKVYGQVFDAQIVFEVWEETNAQVEKLAKQFRQTLAAFTGYLIEKGLLGIKFLRMETDLTSGTIRDSYKIRRLYYAVRFEELSEVPVDIFRAFEVVDNRLHKELGE